MKTIAAACRWLLGALALCVLVAACKRAEAPAAPAVTQVAPAAATAPEDMSPLASAGMPLRGYNYTGEDIDRMTVNGAYGPNVPPYGGGGKGNLLRAHSIRMA